MSLWNDTPGQIDMTGAGTEEGGAGTVQTTNLLSHYKVTVTNASVVNGGLENLPFSVRRVDAVKNPQYIYTHEMNHADGVSRNFFITVEAVDIHGRSSLPVSIGCTNPAPAALAN